MKTVSESHAIDQIVFEVTGEVWSAKRIAEEALNGSASSDSLSGYNDRDDFISGGSGSDVISGGEGNDYLVGEQGTDKLYGNKGHDKLYGGAGDDELTGAEGNDLLIGGTGRDNLNGGIGADTYRFSAGFGEDSISEDGNDQDLVIFGPNIDPAGILLNRYYDHLYVYNRNLGDKLTCSTQKNEDTNRENDIS